MYSRCFFAVYPVPLVCHMFFDMMRLQGLGSFFAFMIGVLCFPAIAVAEGAVFDNVRLAQLRTENLCAITFDDGPGAYTEDLLDVLAERGVHATFFIVGEQGERRKNVVRRMLAEGHEVANHTYSHVSLRQSSPEAQSEQITRTDDLIRSLGGTPRYFRPPYGRYDANTLGIAEEQGLSLVLWSADSQDWRKHNDLRREDVRNDALWLQQSTVAPRGVFLFHDTHKRTVEAIPAILDKMSAAGCRFVTVTEYLEVLSRDRTSITVQAQTKKTAPAKETPPVLAPSVTPPAIVHPGTTPPVETLEKSLPDAVEKTVS